MKQVFRALMLLMKRTFGALMLLSGMALGSWLVYEKFTGQGNDQLRLSGLGFSFALVFVGWRWVSAPRRPRPDARGEDSPHEYQPAPRADGIDTDISNITIAGWGLFLLSGAFQVGEWICLWIWIPGINQMDWRPRTGLLALSVGLTVCFFILGKGLLARFGVRIYRRG